MGEHDPERCVCALGKENLCGTGTATDPELIAGNEVCVCTGPARVRVGADPDEDGVVDFRNRERVGAGDLGENVAAVVEGEIVTRHGLVAGVDLVSRARGVLDSADGAGQTVVGGHFELIGRGIEIAVCIIGVVARSTRVVGPL